MDGWGIATAIGTIAAAVVPAGLYMLERRERIRERVDRKRAQVALDNQLRSQAQQAEQRERAEMEASVRRVGVWNESEPVVLQDMTQSRGTRTEDQAIVYVANRSDDPVHDVSAWTEGVSGSGAPLMLDDWAELAPGGEATRSYTWQTVAMPCWVEFTDVHGRRWARYNNGGVYRAENTEHVPGAPEGERRRPLGPVPPA
ncbi:hypothetical protein [Occultella kanbiaonis]|uniref:hypothetical protein n=1 Tax=Occultella kanbiaonis TaxID=2675754 RepID=UPI0012B894D2|nr:hypothetical protein [Occultella kanbiaonis]